MVSTELLNSTNRSLAEEAVNFVIREPMRASVLKRLPEQKPQGTQVDDLCRRR